MNFAFVTCVQIGLSCMEAIYEAGGKLAFAVTLKDDRAVNKSGRVYLDNFCNKKNIDLLKVDNVNDSEVMQAIDKHNIDWLFIIGWSQIAKSALLLSPQRGVLGMHPTLLPKGRGRAAIPWAIIKNLKKTGVTLFKLDAGVDTGPILDQIEIYLDEKTDATQLYTEVDGAHVALIKQVIPKLLSDSLELQPQDDSLATIWPGRKPEDGLIDVDGSVLDAERLIRAVTKPYPGAFLFLKNQKYTIWKAKFADKKTHSDRLYLDFKDGMLEVEDWETESISA